jgi:hypothetical protein
MNARLKTNAAPKPVVPLTADEMSFTIYEDPPSDKARLEYAAQELIAFDSTRQKRIANPMRLHPDIVIYINKKKNKNTRMKSEALGSSVHMVPERAFTPTPGVSAAWV